MLYFTAVLEYFPRFGTLIEQRLHGLQYQKVKVFPLQQTKILEQDDLVYHHHHMLNPVLSPSTQLAEFLEVIVFTTPRHFV